MSRGGARPGAGRKPNPDARIRVDKAIKAEAQKIAASYANARPEPGQKSAVEVMRQLMNAFLSVAAASQPRYDAERNLIGGDLGRFKVFGSEAAKVAGSLAPFEGPTYSAVRYTQVPADLSKLTDQELEQFARLSAKAAADAGGDQSRAGPTVN